MRTPVEHYHQIEFAYASVRLFRHKPATFFAIDEDINQLCEFRKEKTT